jgi:hypothetical protein
MNVDSIIKTRIENRCKGIDWKALGIEECYIAGNSCNKNAPHDYDLFPIGKDDFEDIETELIDAEEDGGLEIVMESKNAITLKMKNGIIVQLCKYHHPNLEALVDSFDFAHIQIGARVEWKNWGSMGVEELYFTGDWEKAHLLESTFYTGSKYPMSSLIRAFKYHKRGDFAGNSIIFQVLVMLRDIVDRGVEDYEDFKDQLDAVDLAMVPDKFTGEDGDQLMGLFTHLREMPVNRRGFEDSREFK